MRAVWGARVFDGERFTEATTVVLDGERIVDVGTTAPADADVVEVPGATILPGLVDTHQHLCFDGIGSLEEQVAGVPDEELRRRVRAAAALALQAGVTTIRDLGDRSYVTVDVRGEPGLPTILAAGPPLTREGGHCWFLGGACEGEAALRAAVRDRAEHGCDVVKIMVTGGVLTPTFPVWTSQFTTDELRAVVDEAHGLGLPVAAHCHGIGGIESALEARVDSIEHCSFVTDESRSVPNEDLLSRLAASGIGLSMSFGQAPGGTAPPIVQANLGTVVAAGGRLHHLGGRVCVGTDAGISPGKPHDVLPRAMSHLAEAGLDVPAALRCMTSVAAGVVGVGDHKGRLAPGFDADVLVVHGDVRDDDTALLDVAGVWCRGERVR
jgi:imidazolonepropionase-like amidohydrolase